MVYQHKAFNIKLILILFCLALTGLFSQENKPLPQLSGRVVDTLGLLTTEQKNQIINKLNDLDKDTGAEVVLAIIDSTKPETIESYSMRLANQWKPGKKNADNGAILLIAKTDRKLRIEVGYGLEGVLTDARCKQIISNLIVPEFKKGNFQAGIQSGLERMIYILRNRDSIEREEELAKQAVEKKRKEMQSEWRLKSFLRDCSYWWLGLCGVLGVFLIAKEKMYLGYLLPSALFGIPILLAGIFYDDYFLDALWVLLIYLFVYFILWNIINGSTGGSYSGSGSYKGSSYSSGSSSYSSSSYSSSSSSSSSYSGGGGSFGGGGASGSW